MQQAARVILVSESLFVRTVVAGGLINTADIELACSMENFDELKNKYSEFSPNVIVIDEDMLTRAGTAVSEVHSQGQRISIIKLVNRESTNRREVSTLKDKADIDDFMIRLKEAIRRAYLEVPVSPFAQKIAEERSRMTVEKSSRHTENEKFADKSAVKVNGGVKQADENVGKVNVENLQVEQRMIIAIGASTGGTEAMIEVLKNFPANSPAVVIVQHMPEDFTRLYAERLNKICKMEVREAKDGDILRRGLALIAPGNLQMRVVENPSGGYKTSVMSGEKVSGHRPSVDVMFTSVAENVKCKTVGVIMTGMGSDGAAGLLQMRKNGAFTIGQNKETCVVYGMPAVASELGAVSQEVALDKIAETVNAYVLGSKT